VVAAVLAFGLVISTPASASPNPAEVTVRSGPLSLHALLWKPPGRGPFPAVLFNHGSYRRGASLDEGHTAALGEVFAKHGFVFLYVFRRGVGPSADHGTPDGDLMEQAFVAAGQEGRNRMQLEVLEEELQDAAAGADFLRRRSDVDPDRVAVVGHSFGGSLSLLQVACDPTIRAAVTFSGLARSWTVSPELREKLLAAVRESSAAILFIHAANDYSTAPGEALAAEMEKAGKPHRIEIYPAVGETADDGHNLILASVAVWEADVFAFLEAFLR
jgi:carboxymethylenebutenolidase